MAPPNLQHRRTHNLLLISKLLNQRDAASPFTLILDSLEQTGVPLVAEYVKRAKAAKVQVLFVSFETLNNVYNANVFISAWRAESSQEWQSEVTSHLKKELTQRKLLIIDSLNTLSATDSNSLPTLLSAFLSPTTALLATYHLDIPAPPPASQTNAYAPAPLTLLEYLATTIITTHSFHHVVARAAARARSHVEPSFGLEEGVEGVIQGLSSNGTGGLVLELEHRRKSGRGVREWYFLPLKPRTDSLSSSGKGQEIVQLLEDHPEYARLSSTGDDGGAGEAGLGATFEMGLTERQKADREGVVLPYFDAQRGEGGGEGEGSCMIWAPKTTLTRRRMRYEGGMTSNRECTI